MYTYRAFIPKDGCAYCHIFARVLEEGLVNKSMYNECFYSLFPLLVIHHSGGRYHHVRHYYLSCGLVSFDKDIGSPAAVVNNYEVGRYK